MTVVASKYALKVNELYETEAWAVDAVIRSLKKLRLWRNGPIWEPSAGNHAMVVPLLQAGATNVITSDIIEYNHPHDFIMDFLTEEKTPRGMEEYDIVGNPPYGRQNRLAVRFAEKALSRCDGYVALLLTAKFDFGSTRKHLFMNNPRWLAKVALLDRISWEGNGETGTEDHAWYIWGPRDGRRKSPKILYETNSNKGANFD